MKKTIQSILIASALFLSLASTASAGELTGTTNITVNVTAYCSFTPASDLTMDAPVGSIQFDNNSNYITVFCNNSLPYTLSVDNAPGGTFDMDNPNGSKWNSSATIVNYNTVDPEVPFGQDGEALHGIGTGNNQLYLMRLTFGSAWVHNFVPDVGQWTHTMNYTLAF